MADEPITRREAVKRAVYVTPVIITMAANFSFASAGSGSPGLNNASGLNSNSQGPNNPPGLNIAPGLNRRND